MMTYGRNEENSLVLCSFHVSMSYRAYVVFGGAGEIVSNFHAICFQ